MFASAFAVANDNSEAKSESEKIEEKQEPLIPKVTPPDKNEYWMAIVGDSSVTGAATHPSLAATLLNLMGHLAQFMTDQEVKGLPLDFDFHPYPNEFNITNPLQPQTRITYSKREFDVAKADKEATQLNRQSKASIRLDTPEYSFGYMIGRKLGIKSEHIVNVGQNGKKYNSLTEQFHRIFEVSETLPPLVLVSYVANDFCNPDNFKKPASAFRKTYSETVARELKQIENLPPSALGTRILILAPFDVVNVLTNPDLLEQEIPFEGHERLKCEKLRKGEVGKSFTSRKMLDALVGACRGVLSPNPSSERVAQVKEFQDIQVEVLSEAVERFNKSSRPGLKAELALSTRNIDFKMGDLANDCFHPGIRGHARIARQLLSHELK